MADEPKKTGNTYPPERAYDAVGGAGKVSARVSIALAGLVIAGITIMAFALSGGDSSTGDQRTARPIADENAETPRTFEADNPFLAADGPGGASSGPKTANIIATTDCAVCPAMVVIPGGQFIMGISEAEAIEENIPQLHIQSELPRHGVTLNQTFAVGQTEITRAQFAAFVNETGHDAIGCIVLQGQTWFLDPTRSWRDPGFEQQDDEPAVCISGTDAEAYAAWLTEKTGKRYRVPSETEWEYAARSGAIGARYDAASRDKTCDYANVAGQTHATQFRYKATHLVFPCDSGHALTAASGRFTPNGFGLFDTLGNVREVVADCWNPNHWNKQLGAAARQDGDCTSRVVKGGGWYDAPHNIRLARRIRAGHNERRADQGFRVAKDVPLQHSTQ